MKIYYHIKPRQSGLSTKMVEKCAKFKGKFLYFGQNVEQVRSYQKLYLECTSVSKLPVEFKIINQNVCGYDRCSLIIFDECDFDQNLFYDIIIHLLETDGEVHIISTPIEKFTYTKSDVELVRKMRTIYGYDTFDLNKLYVDNVNNCVNSIIYTDLYKPYKESRISKDIIYSLKLFNDFITLPSLEIVDDYKTLIKDYESIEHALGEKRYDLQILGNFWE